MDNTSNKTADAIPIKVFLGDKLLGFTSQRRANRLVSRSREAEWIRDDAILMIGGRIHRKEIKEKLLKEHGRRCYICGRQLDETEPISLDHIHPRSRCGEDSLENCELCCLACNRLKKNDDMASFLQRIQNGLSSSGSFPSISPERIAYLKKRYVTLKK